MRVAGKDESLESVRKIRRRIIDFGIFFLHPSPTNNTKERVSADPFRSDPGRELSSKFYFLCEKLMQWKLMPKY